MVGGAPASIRLRGSVQVCSTVCNSQLHTRYSSDKHCVKPLHTAYSMQRVCNEYSVCRYATVFSMQQYATPLCPSDTKRRPIAIQHQPRWLGWRAPPRHAPAGHSSERFVFVHGFVLKRLCRTVRPVEKSIELKSKSRSRLYQRSARRCSARRLRERWKSEKTEPPAGSLWRSRRFSRYGRD